MNEIQNQSVRRLNAASRAVQQACPALNEGAARNLAAEALYAARRVDESQSTWPTKEQARLVAERSVSNAWEWLRFVMIKDPIIEAAIAYRDAMRDGVDMTGAPEDLINAVDKAGL